MAAIPIREVTPLVAAFIRHGIIGVGSLGVLLFFRSQWKKLLLTDHIILMITGICLGIYNWLYLEGIKYSAVMDGVFIESAFVPILTILILFWMKTRITRNQLIGVIIAIMGSCFFFYPIVQLHSFGTTRIIGIFLLLLSVCAWIGYTLIGKIVFTKIDPIFATAYAMMYSCIFLTIITYSVIPSINLSTLSTSFWIALVFLGLFSSVIGNILYSIGVKHIGSAISSMFLFFVPVIGFLLAHLWLSEKLFPLQLLGALIMLIGVWFANRVGQD